MGAAVVEKDEWLLVIGGLVEWPFALTFNQLCQLPRRSVTAFHECYGSPSKPPTEAVWRIGNVVWTGVSLESLLDMARPLHTAAFVWSEGLDYGTFHGVTADRYQKDLPMTKAPNHEVLVAYEMNGQPVGKKRGGPVGLVVPGWFGTNMIKWLCHLSLQDRRAEGPYTTTFYNEIDPTDPEGKKRRPVWKVEANSIISSPEPGTVFRGPDVQVEGCAWCCEEVIEVLVSADAGHSWVVASVTPRAAFEWQRWEVCLKLQAGEHKVMARARSVSGQQPLGGRRNHVHTVAIQVVAS